jgi:hypothetical protein
MINYQIVEDIYIFIMMSRMSNSCSAKLKFWHRNFTTMKKEFLFHYNFAAFVLAEDARAGR